MATWAVVTIIVSKLHEYLPLFYWVVAMVVGCGAMVTMVLCMCTQRPLNRVQSKVTTDDDDTEQRSSPRGSNSGRQANSKKKTILPLRILSCSSLASVQDDTPDVDEGPHSGAHIMDNEERSSPRGSNSGRQASSKKKTILPISILSCSSPSSVQDDALDDDDDDHGDKPRAHTGCKSVIDHTCGSHVWQRSILMGERCEPPAFSGLILYDERGNRVPELPCRSPRRPPSPSLLQLMTAHD